MATILSKSVVFITGTFIGNNCWDDWKLYFESKGYQCIAPAWPNKKASPEELRNKHPDEAIASNRLDKLVDYFETEINALPGQSIVIGHSLGGLIVQLLLQREVGVAGVAIHSFPTAGVNTFNFSFLKSMWSAFGFFTPIQKTYMLSFKKWKRVIVNGMTCDQQKESFYKYAIPESKWVARDAFKCNARVNFKQPHAPLLFVSGSCDRVIPASLNNNNYKKYSTEHSITGYIEFKGRNHLIFEHPAWKEEADFIFNWLQEIR